MTRSAMLKRASYLAASIAFAVGFFAHTIPPIYWRWEYHFRAEIKDPGLPPGSSDSWRTPR